MVLDTGGARVHIGLILDGQWAGRKASSTQALESLFELTGHILNECGFTLDKLRAFAFCNGPGSTLGLRLASAAILTWQTLHPHPRPVWHYHSLSLAWIPLRPHISENENPWLITDYRKKNWLGCPADDANSIHELDTEFIRNLPGPVYYLPQRTAWSPPPIEVTQVEYPFARLTDLLEIADEASIGEQPELALPGKSDYIKWTPGRHRAPGTK